MNTFDEAYLDPDEQNYIKPMCINIWNKDLGEKDGLFGYMMPSDTIELQFTVSGFNYDKAADEAPVEETPAVETEAEAPADADKDPDEKNNTPLIVGIVAGIVAVAGVGAGVVVSKKKKAK